MILDAILKRASIHDPSTPLTGSNLTIDQVFGGQGTSDSGIVVTPQTALELSPVWAAVNVISGSVAKLPLHVHRKLEPSGSEIDREHPAEMLLKKPFPLMVSNVYKQLVMVHVLMYGNHVSLVVRDNGGRPIELIPLAPGKIRITQSMDGEYWYECWMNGVEVKALAMDIVHVKQFGFDGITGLSTVTKGKNTIGLGLSLNRHSNNFFKNFARPSIVFKHPGILGEEAHKRLKDSWVDADLNGGIAIIEEDMDLKEFGVTPEDSQQVEQMNLSVQDVARLFNIQPSKLQDHSRSTFTNSVEMNRAYLDDTLDPWLTAIEEEFADKLLAPSEKRMGTHFLKFNTKKLTRMHLKDRNESYSVARLGGWMSVNDIRAAEDLPPVPGGDERLKPLNHVALETVVEPKAMPTDAGRQNLVEAIQRLLPRVITKAQKATREPSNFMTWLDRGLVDENADTLCQGLTTPVRILGGDESEAKHLTELVFDSLRGDLLEMSGRNNAEQIYGAMERLGQSWLMTKPEKLVDDFIVGRQLCQIEKD